jgi:hypothetical protein
MVFFQEIKKIIRWFIPYGIWKINHKRNLKKNMKNYTQEEYQKKHKNEISIRNYFLGLSRNEQSSEILEIIEYFEKHKFSIFPYEFARKYHAEDIDVFYDISCDMCFILHNGKKIFFPHDMSFEKIRKSYHWLCMEQDVESPHRYETKEYKVKAGDIIADVGAAEGIWALDNVEVAEKIYIFEYQQEWIEALQKTFEPWKEKVCIIKKFVSNVSDKNNITMDEYFMEKTINFIKVDIEGSEVAFAEGCKALFSKSDDLRLLMCTYHKENDAKELKEILENEGFMTEYSARYMLFIHDKELKEPYIRRGLIRANKIIQKHI